MPMQRRERNLDLLSMAAANLAPLLDRLVFLGGGTTDLFITDPAAPNIRATKDVDVIAEITHFGEYAQLGEALRKLGFHEPSEKEAQICRWQMGDLLVDVMPTDEKILGFGNRWYAEAAENSVQMTLPNGHVIRHVTAPYFLGTKLEAFESRGKKDFFVSHDFEDLVAVTDGRRELLEELRNSPVPLRTYVAGRMREYIGDPVLLDALPGVILDPGSERAGIVFQRMQAIAGLAK